MPAKGQPRSLWKGSLTIGLVNVPVKLVTATKGDRISFNNVFVHKDGTIEKPRQAYLLADDKEVPKENDTYLFSKGYPVGDGFIVIEPEELDECSAVQDRTISLDRFVEEKSIDPTYLTTPYLVFPDDRGDHGYATLVRAMRRRKVVGVGKYVMRTKQYLVSVRPRGNMLVMQHMFYASEMTDVQPWDAGLGEIHTTPAEINLAVKMIDLLTEPLEIERYEDEVKERTRQLIEAKMKGKGVKLAKPPAATAPSVDILQDIQRTLDAKTADNGKRAATKTRAKTAASKAKSARTKAK